MPTIAGPFGVDEERTPDVLDRVMTVGLRLFGQARQLAGDRRGVTVVEYGVIAALVVVVSIGAIGTLGQAVFTDLYQRISTATSAANSR